MKQERRRKMITFCKICHKPIIIPVGVNIGGELTIKCPDGHEQIIGANDMVNNRIATVKERQAAMLERQIKMLDDYITRSQTMLQNMQKQHQARIDADTKKRDELKAKLTELG
jgi:hypothetical protein